MAVTTHATHSSHRSSAKPQKVRALSDLHHLVHENAGAESEALQSVSSTTTESNRTMNAAQTSQVRQPGADLADQAAAAQASQLGQGAQTGQQPEPLAAPASESPEEMHARLIAEARNEMMGDIRGLMTDIEKSISTSLTPITQEQTRLGEGLATAGKDITSLTKRIELGEAKIKALVEGKPQPEETSFLLRSAAVVKDVGSYAGFGLLAGFIGKGVYDLVQRERAEA